MMDHSSKVTGGLGAKSNPIEYTMDVEQPRRRRLNEPHTTFQKAEDELTKPEEDHRLAKNEGMTSQGPDSYSHGLPCKHEPVATNMPTSETLFPFIQRVVSELVDFFRDLLARMWAIVCYPWSKNIIAACLLIWVIIIFGSQAYEGLWGHSKESASDLLSSKKVTVQGEDIDATLKAFTSASQVVVQTGQGNIFALSMAAGENAVHILHEKVKQSKLERKNRILKDLDWIEKNLDNVQSDMGELKARAGTLRDDVTHHLERTQAILERQQKHRASTESLYMKAFSYPCSIFGFLCSENSLSIPEDDAFTKKFFRGATQIRNRAQDLINFALTVQSRLQELRGHIRNIGNSSSDENRDVNDKNSAAQERLLLVKAWAHVTGEEYKRQTEYEDNLEMLTQIDRFHKDALQVVAAVIQHLNEMKSNLGQLKGHYGEATFDFDNDSLGSAINRIRGSMGRITIGGDSRPPLVAN